MSCAPATPIYPSSLSDLLWRFAAPLAYMALCIAELAIIYATSQCLSDRERRKLEELHQLELVAAKAGDAELQVKLIRERDRVMAAHGLVSPFLVVNLGLVALGLAAGVLRVATLPRPECRAEWWLVSLMLLSLGGQVPTLIFAGACAIALP